MEETISVAVLACLLFCGVAYFDYKQENYLSFTLYSLLALLTVVACVSAV